MILYLTRNFYTGHQKHEQQIKTKVKFHPNENLCASKANMRNCVWWCTPVISVLGAWVRRIVGLKSCWIHKTLYLSFLFSTLCWAISLPPSPSLLKMWSCSVVLTGSVLACRIREGFHFKVVRLALAADRPAQGNLLLLHWVLIHGIMAIHQCAWQLWRNVYTAVKRWTVGPALCKRAWHLSLRWRSWLYDSAIRLRALPRETERATQKHVQLCAMQCFGQGLTGYTQSWSIKIKNNRTHPPM